MGYRVKEPRLRYVFPVACISHGGQTAEAMRSRWGRINWEQALNLIALRLSDIKDNYGAESVVFSRSTSAGTASIDFDGWFQRLANVFGSPNILGSHHICTWNRTTASKYTYGSGMPTPDFDQTRCMLLGAKSHGYLAAHLRASCARATAAPSDCDRSRKTNLASKRLLAAVCQQDASLDGDAPCVPRKF